MPNIIFMARKKENAAPTMEQFKLILKDKKLKATNQRLAVHEAMLALGHASADMVVEYINAMDEAKVTVASVYNILSNLADIKVYHRRMSANNKMYFDVNTFKHAHLYDSVNNEYKDVIDAELIKLVEGYLKERKFRGYKVDTIDIQIVCHPTRRRSNTL